MIDKNQQEMDKAICDVRNFLQQEIARAKRTLKDGKWSTILVGISDSGTLSVHPCRLLLPFHYPASIDELDTEHPSHFELAESILRDPGWRPDERETANSEETALMVKYFGNHAFTSYRNAPRLWSARSHEVSLLRDAYEKASAKESRQRHLDRIEKLRLEILREACGTLDSKLTIIGIESDSEEWWEVITFHIHGPTIPPPPQPVSDVQLFCRLRRHTHSYIGLSAFVINRRRIVELSLDGADTTDATIDLMRGIEDLKSLCAGLKRLSLQSTRVTKKSLQFLQSELPHVKVSWSAY